jgi:iron complex transport system ATP-binding protein
MKSAVEIDRATVLMSGTEVLKEISLVIREGEHLCLLGPNGSGKSSIVGLVSGDIPAVWRATPPVRLFGEELWDLFALRGRLGIVSDRLQLRHSRGETVMEVLLSAFFGSVGVPSRAEVTEGMRAKAAEVASFLGLSALLGRASSTLSSGEMRRVLLGRALVHDPEMLLMDEPYTSLDIAARHAFSLIVRSLAAKGHAIVLVTHDLAEIPPEIERVVMVKEGRILADGPRDELLRDETMSELYGIRLRVEREDGHCRAVVAGG